CHLWPSDRRADRDARAHRRVAYPHRPGAPPRLQSCVAHGYGGQQGRARRDRGDQDRGRRYRLSGHRLGHSGTRRGGTVGGLPARERVRERALHSPRRRPRRGPPQPDRPARAPQVRCQHARMSQGEFSGTMPVSDRQRLDEASLGRWLHGHLPRFAGRARIEQFRGGQSNPTFLLTAEDGAQYVLRKKPAGTLLPSAHAVDREFRVISALHGSDVPVARPLCLCTDESVIGTMFYVMEFAAGRNFWDATLPHMKAPERAALYDEMNRVIVALHQLDYVAAGLADYGRPGNYFARQIARWSGQYRASETERIEAMEKLLTWLPANIPAGDETALVHGDYRLDNLIFDSRTPRMLAVVDWELSTLGHPLAAFSFHRIARGA